MSFAPEPAYAHGTAREDRGPALQPRHARRADAQGGAALPGRVPERPARGRDPARCCGCRSCTASSCASRPAKSARKYASIWTPEGSPLKVWTEKQALLLAGLSRPARPPRARPPRDALRPAFDRQRARRAQGGGRRARPGAAALSAVRGGDDGEHRRRVAAWMRACRNLPELRFVKHYHDDPGYIDALAAPGQRALAASTAAPDKLVLSFHGLPQRSLTLGDPYHCECLKTGAPARRAPEAARRVRRGHVPEPLRQGRVAEALHRADAGRAGASRASPGSTCSARASRPTAWRRSRRSTRRRAPRSSPPAARSSATSPASTTSTSGSPRWPRSP